MITEIERIFHEALERPEYERGEYVARACGENTGLAKEVESLVRRHTNQTLEFAGAVQTVAADLIAAAAAGSEIGPGVMLGPYRVERKVGEGGMGTVYAAMDTRLGRQVAIKLVRRTLGDHAAALARFQQEARSAAALAHPNIAILHDFGESDGAPWLVMEYVGGSSLRARLRTGRLEVRAILRYAGQLAAALEHAHSRGIVHHDIKPENIMIGGDGVLKVIDFGIASIVRAANAPAGPVTGFLGTVFYSAPELFAGERETEGCDVYSFGVVLYEMACGALPYSQSSIPALYDAIRQGEHVRARMRNPALTAGLSSFIDRCLAADPAERYRNGTRLAAALRAIVNDAKLSRHPSENTPDSVAIFDFANITADPAVDWLGAGFAETMASRLAKLPAVRVTSRPAIRQAVAAGVDPAAIGRRLDARWVVTGSYQRIGGEVRVTPQLMEAATGEVLLTETIDGRWDDLFDLQDRAAKLLSGELSQQAGRVELQAILAPDTRNLMAYEQYTKGREKMTQMQPGTLAAAIEHFELAVALDPDYALAYSGLGACFAMQFLRTSIDEDLKRAGAHLERATALDPELGEPHLWLGYIRARLNDPAGAFAACRRSVELQPEHAMAHYMTGGFPYMFAETRMGSLHRGMNHLAEAIRLQPRLHCAWVSFGTVAAFLGRHDLAIRILTEAARMENEPDLQFRFVGAFTLRATAWMRRGAWSEAREGFANAVRVLQSEAEHHYRECYLILSFCGLGDVALRCGEEAAALGNYRRAWRLVKETPRIAGSARLLIRAGAGMAAAYAATGEINRARELAHDVSGQLESVTGELSTVTLECGLAQLHLALAVAMLRLGDVDAGASHLQRASDTGWCDLPWILGDPELRPLHEHRAYIAFVEKLRAMPPVTVPDVFGNASGTVSG